MSELTDLERSLLRLNELVRSVRTNNVWYKGPYLKPGTSYLTNDGYYLGDIVWYMAVCLEGYDLRVFGASAEKCTANTIFVFEKYIQLRGSEDRAIQDWLEEFQLDQLAVARDYARQLSREEAKNIYGC